RNRYEIGRVEGAGSRAAGVGAAPDPIRARNRQGELTPGCGAGVCQARPLEAQSHSLAARRLRPPETMRASFAAVVAAATAIAFAFLLLPIVAIFVRVPVGHLFAQLGDNASRDALVVSLKTSAIAHGSVLLVGTPVAY